MLKIVVLSSDESEDKIVMLVPIDYDHYEIEKAADDNDIPAPTIEEHIIDSLLAKFLASVGVVPYRPFVG